MEHFTIIQALCRAALPVGGSAVRHQVERLRDAARKNNDYTSARSLEQLLSKASKAAEMVPSRLTQSRAMSPMPLKGEELTVNTAVPVDRETASPLADVIFPDFLPEVMPIFTESLSDAARTLIEEWQNAEALAKIGVYPSTTCLLFGPPGVGKTTLALWMARQLQIPAVVARIDGLISSFLGTTARNVGNLFAFANRYRCVLVLDEFDAVAKVRDDPHEVGEIKRVVNALLQNIDARRGNGITIAVTNHESLLDPAIWRRFEIQLQIPKPNIQGRLAIVQANLPPTDPGKAVERFVSWLTDGLSGAEVETYVKGLKKALAIQTDKSTDIIPALKRSTLLSGPKMNALRIRILTLEPQEAAQQLAREPELQLTQLEIAQILSKDKATVNRWLKQADAKE